MTESYLGPSKQDRGIWSPLSGFSGLSIRQRLALKKAFAHTRIEVTVYLSLALAKTNGM